MPAPAFATPVTDVNQLIRYVTEALQDAPQAIPQPIPRTLDFTPEVDAGVAFLDERFGRDFWLPRVDLDTLNLASTLSCVVCQVTGLNFVDGVRLLNDGKFSYPWVAKHGFYVRDADLQLTPLAYRDLQHAWESAVARLRAESDDSARITA